MNREKTLRRRVAWLTWIVIAGLVASGATAIPLEWETRKLAQFFEASELPAGAGGIGVWLSKVSEGLEATNRAFPFIAYGTDWLAFGHLVIAIAFVGVLRDPVRNVWLLQFGMIASALVIPWACFFGEMRGIPWGWRLIDASFGIGAMVPLGLALRYTRELESIHLRRA